MKHGKEKKDWSFQYLTSTENSLVIATEIHESHCFPTKSGLILQNILSKIATEEANDLKFIPYELNSIGNKKNMRNVIIQNNEFLYNMAIVSILGVKHEEEDNVFAIFSEAELISGIGKIRKVGGEK